MHRVWNALLKSTVIAPTLYWVANLPGWVSCSVYPQPKYHGLIVMPVTR